MNLYLVVSEWLEPYSYSHPEPGYRIAELVVARNHGQAKYLAWKNDKDSFPAWGHTDMADMPKMAARLKRHGVPSPARIVSNAYDYLGFERDECPNPEVDELWDLGPAAHIGL